MSFCLSLCLYVFIYFFHSKRKIWPKVILKSDILLTLQDHMVGDPEIDRFLQLFPQA